MRHRNQSGYLAIRGKRTAVWWGEWQVYEGSKRRKMTMTLGRCDEMTRPQARARLRELILRTNKDASAIHSIGRESTAKIPNEVEKISGSKIGALVELLVCADLMAKGWDVYRATDPVCTCDLIAVRAGETIRLEVKTKAVRLDLRSKSGKFDVLALMDRESGVIRYLPYHELGDLAHPNLDGPNCKV